MHESGQPNIKPQRIDEEVKIEPLNALNIEYILHTTTGTLGSESGLKDINKNLLNN